MDDLDRAIVRAWSKLTAKGERAGPEEIGEELLQQGIVVSDLVRRVVRLCAAEQIP